MSEQQFDTSMGRSEFATKRNSENLRQDIEAQKEAIHGTIRQIDRRVHRATDWRAQVVDHPFLAIAAAFAVGGLLSGLFRRKPTPRERILDALAESVEDVTDTVRKRVVSHMTRGVSKGVLKAAGAAILMRMAASRLPDQSIDEPEFADQDQ